MNILKDFDTAIAAFEPIPKGYSTDKGCYDSYMNCEAWKAYLEGMCERHKAEFGGGSGGELEEKNGRPPKMASFASSSRMIYLLSKDIPGFSFEKKLSTVIGGIANMDGYLEADGRFTFVEAKCREPYSHKSPQSIKLNYKPLYEYLQSKMPEAFSCIMDDVPGTRDMRVNFFCRGNEVVYFDIKQMLCHLLGVAHKMLTDNVCDAPIQFLYLLYNPDCLALPQDSREEILRIHRDTCFAAENYDFVRIFGHVVDFLMCKKDYPATEVDAERLKTNFRFALCDQNDYREYFS